MKKMKFQKKKTTWLLGLVVTFSFAFFSCTPTEEYTDDIIGKWELIKVDNYEPEPGFTWEFKEDLSYTIVNNIGRFEDDPFESTPFRAEGTYEGFYLVDAPKGMGIREKYRAPMRFSALEISEDGSELEMHFYPIKPRDEDETEWIVAKFKRLN